MTFRLAILCALVVAQTAVADPPKPAITAEAVLSIDDLNRVARVEDENALLQLVANTPDSEVEEKSDYFFRLATSYAARFHVKRTKEDLLRSVKAFKALCDNDAFRNYPRLDSALFYYGYTLQSGAYMKEARAIYDRLLKNFPSSKYVPEAHLAFAEYFFDANQLADAEARYKMVLKFPKSSAYWYAMYKLGWIDLALQRDQEALEAFFQVVQATKHDSKQVALGREAMRDFVRAYVEVGKPDKAYATFQRVDPVGAQDMLERFAELELERGKPDLATAAYRQLVKLAPASTNACRWQSAIAHTVANTPDEQAATEALVAMKCTDALTAEQKQRVALAALRGWQELVPTDVKLAAPPRKLPVAEPIPAADQTMLDNLDRFADQVSPDDLAQLQLVKAAIYRKHAHHDEAIVILNQLVAHQRDPKLAERAVDLWLDSLVQLHRFDTALEVVDALVADKSYVDDKPMLRRNIQFLRSGSLR